MTPSAEPTLEVRSVDDWRAWLAAHGSAARSVWLVLQHKDSPHPGIGHRTAVEHALCFGWIDGLHRSQNHHSSVIRFTPRTTRSSWSALNRERAAAMIEAGLMTPFGQVAIDDAKARGSWPSGS